MENKKIHWESIYKLNDFKKVSWYQENPTRSKTFIQNLNLDKSSPIIDIGGGASYLANSLINTGYRDVTVNDISSNAKVFLCKISLKAFLNNEIFYEKKWNEKIQRKWQ